MIFGGLPVILVRQRLVPVKNAASIIPKGYLNATWLCYTDTAKRTSIRRKADFMDTNTKRNPKCECPSRKCPNRGICKLCKANHHKGLHTFCTAGKPERALRIVFAKLTGQ